jgi:putative hydrolase of the HAD superfamily
VTSPKAILFDLDETILSFGERKVHAGDVAKEFPELASIPNFAEIVEDAFVRFWSDEDKNGVWRFRLVEARAIIVSGVFQELKSHHAGLTDEIAHRFAERFSAYRDEQCRFFPGAIETVDEFKRRGVKLGLVTNGASDTQRGKVVRYDLARRFDHVQIEQEVGFGKPREQAYLHAMEALGVTASETWMVGDNLEWEVVAPQRLGIYSVWNDHLGRGLPPGSKVVPDRIVRSIAELI